jgi:uncharacterized protein with HEPN domain
MEELDRSLLHLELIIEMIGKIQKQLQNRVEAQFLEDGDAIDLCAFRLSQIGETASKLPKDVQDRNPQIPWKAMFGMRHLIVHEYGGSFRCDFGRLPRMTLFHCLRYALVK